MRRNWRFGLTPESADIVCDSVKTLLMTIVELTILF